MRRLGFGILAAMALVGGTACSDDDGDAGVAAELLYVSGREQVPTLGAPLPQPLVVEVVSQGGEPVAGVELRWDVTGGGSVNDPSTNTGEDGRSSVTFTVGAAAGVHTVQVRAPGLDIGDVVFSWTAEPGNDDGGDGELP